MYVNITLIIIVKPFIVAMIMVATFVMMVVMCLFLLFNHIKLMIKKAPNKFEAFWYKIMLIIFSFLLLFLLLQLLEQPLVATTENFGQ